jgi:hypothetical protein
MAKKVKDDVLSEAAKAIGTVAGKIATLAGVAEHAPTPPKPKIAKLQKKNNVHLPRKVKKQQKKTAAAKAKA